LGEFLAGTPKGDVAEQVRLIDESFQVSPFDAMAAVFAGEIWRNHHDLMTAKQYGTGKQCIKSDCWIFATALAAGATVIYAEDRWFHTIAKKYAPRIAAKKIPKMADRPRPLAGMEDE
jgi:predicted nucleic acid-binding protein